MLNLYNLLQLQLVIMKSQLLVLFVLTGLYTHTCSGQEQQIPNPLVRVLENAYDQDQQIRDTLNRYGEKFGPVSMEYKKVLKRMMVVDSSLQQQVFPILDKYGYPSKKQSSDKASKGVFMVLQHAELNAQLKYAPLLDQAFLSGEVDKWSYAFYKDRINMRQGKFQAYGSQVLGDNLGNLYVHPILDEPNVDKRRKKLGMGPLKDHLAANGVQNYVLPKRDTLKGKVVVIGHFWDAAQKPVAGITVWLKDKQVGTATAKGFFEVAVQKYPQEKLILSFVRAGYQTITYPLTGDKDVYQIYMQLK